MSQPLWESFWAITSAEACGIEEAVPDHLADHLGRSAVMGLGPALVTLEAWCPQLGESGPQLKVALLAEAELPGGPDRPQPFALALDQHRQLAGDLVILAHRQTTLGPRPGPVSSDQTGP